MARRSRLPAKRAILKPIQLGLRFSTPVAQALLEQDSSSYFGSSLRLATAGIVGPPILATKMRQNGVAGHAQCGVRYVFGSTIRFCKFLTVYGEPGAWLWLVGVTVNTYSLPALLLIA